MGKQSAFSRTPLWAVGLLCLSLAGCGSSRDKDAEALKRLNEQLGASATCVPAEPLVQTRQIDPRRIDARLFDAVVLNAVNAERCARGLAPLAADPALTRAAANHSADMARLGFFAHRSPVSGRTRLWDRFIEADVLYRQAAENIATLGLYRFGERRFYILDQARCQFSFSPGGPPIQRHSYASAAQTLVANWMASPGHRRNILSPGLTRHGAAIAIQPDAQFCGTLLATQNFAG